MRSIDFMSVFFLLASAPFWQIGLDNICAGLGSALLVLLLTGAIRAAHADVMAKDRS